MRRRKLLVGFGGLVGGSSLIVGSNAFSSVEAEREFDATIVEDEDDAFVSVSHPDSVVVSSYDIVTGGTRNRRREKNVPSASSAPPASRADEVVAVVDSAGDSNGVGTKRDGSGVFRIDNRLPASIESELSADHDGVWCSPNDRNGAQAVVEQGERAGFDIHADCTKLDDDGETVGVTAQVSGNADDSVSGSIRREIEISRKLYIAVSFGCSRARIDLATDRDQSGVHLPVQLPIELEATVVDGPQRETLGPDGKIWNINGLFWEPDASYDKVEKLEVDDAGDGTYTFENTLTQHSDDGEHDYWECKRNWTEESV